MKTINLDLNESCKDIKLGDFIIYDNKTYKFTTNSFKLIEKPIIDNFELLSEFLPEEKIEDEFYHVQILKRKKENPDIKSNSILINSYFVKNQKQLNYLKEEIVFLCKHNNARAYINLNVRDKKQLVIPMMNKLISHLENQDFSTVHRIFDSVCGSYTKTKNKLWVVDLDDISKEYIESSVIPYIESLSSDDTSICKTIVPTINGYHIITNPFNSSKFLKIFPNIDIQKNNPTLLYYDN